MNIRNRLVLIFGLIFSLLFTGCGRTGNTTEQGQIITEPTQSQSSTQEPSSDHGDNNQSPSDLSADTTFHFETKSVMLNSGYEMPIIGLGTWTQDNETVENSVYHALKDGYRLIDTANMYGNEEGVGKGVRRAIEEGIVTREEVFITTKLVPWGYEDYETAIEEANEILGLGYIDLFLIHQQGSAEKELYQAIENAIDKGIVRSLGISNYYTPEDFERVTEGATIMPAVIQNENHIFHQNTKLQNYLKQYGTIVESYYPFGGRGHTADSMNHETIAGIAEAHGKTGAQIILRWHLQAGYIAIPGSSNPDHIAENIDIFDFELSNGEMQQIADLNTGVRYESW